MPKPEQDKWVKLTLGFRKRYLFIKYEDGAGNKSIQPLDAYRLAKVPLFFDIRINKEVDTFLAAMLEAEPKERHTPYGFKRLPLAIYTDIDLTGIVKWLIFSSPLFLAFGIWQTLFEQILHDKSYQFLLYREIPVRPKFELPYRIHLTGDQSSQIRSQITNWQWFAADRATQTFGLQITEGFYDRDEQPDILITDRTQPVPEGISPRLMILIGPETPDFTPETIWFPQSTVLSFFSPFTEIFLKEFLYSIIHDFPLSEALHFSLRRLPAPVKSVYLQSSPKADHALRLSDGLAAFRIAVDQYAQTINPGNLDQFIRKLPKTTGTELRKAFAGADHLGNYFSHIDNIVANFGRETSGLVPLSGSIEDFKTYREPELTSYKANLLDLVNQPTLYHHFRTAQQREVDITVDQLTDALQYIPTNKYASLFIGGRYRLNVRIGQRSPQSVVTGPVTSLDTLLPDPPDAKGHELEVVIFPKDFLLRSPHRTKIRLPLLGGSNFARFYFEIPTDLSLAQMRIAVFYENYLLQAFIFEAELSLSPEYHKEPTISARMDLATSAKFNNLDELGKRDLYIGLNAGQDGSHSLFVKNDGVIREVHGLNERLLDDAQQTFSRLLNSAYFDNGQLRFPVNAVNPDKTGFDDIIRQFAKTGRLYYDRLFSNNDAEFRKTLRTVRDGHDLNLQIARHEVNYAFPWPLIYDYSLLPPAAGAPEYPVCMGEPLDARQYAAFQCSEGEGCPHNPGIYTYCIAGFWGFRHRIEQLLPVSQSQDTAIALKNKQKTVMYVRNFKDDYSEELQEHLGNLYNLDLITHEHSLIDLLWNAKSRPSSLVIFGHLENQTIAGEPDEDRILTFLKENWPANGGTLPLNKWLYHRLLTNKITNANSWSGEPLPLVFLMSCYNATMTVNALHSMIQDFHTAGASAVIGTECAITSDLGAQFIKEVLNALYEQDLELGTAIQHFNQARFKSYNPLAFVFTCFGNSNLKIA